MHSQSEKKPEVFICSSIFIEGGEYRMRKSDKGKKVFGLILILAIIVSVFGGVVSAEDISEDLTKSVADTRLFDKNNNFDSAGENSYSNISKVNIPLPLTTRVEGIDVSHWQGNIDWSSVYNSGKKFAFAKATEGVGFTDPNFDKNMNEAHAAGMLIGAYHYARPDLGNDAADEARYFVSVAGKYLKDGYLRPALDLEEGASLGKVALSNWVHEWMETVKSETGIEPIIYVNSNYANNYLDSSVTKYNLWIAHWRCDTGTPPNTGIWADWDFWQYYSPNYCGQNSVPGISGGVDLDIFNGDMSSLYTFVITGGTDGIIPLTGDMYGNDIDITGFYNANTAEFTFGGEAVRFGQMADKGTDTTGTYYAGKSRFIFDKRTEDTANIEFANQSAELGVVGSRGLSFGTQVGEYINGVIAYSNYENAYASGLYNFVDGYNTGMKWQCVEYVNRYYKAIYGMEIRIPGTNANDYYGTASDRGLIAYPNSGSTSPQPGDILCSDGGSYGHVAIVRGVTTGSIHVIHQNWANTGADNDKIISMSISGGHYTVSGFSASYPVQGWLRKPGGITQIPITGDMYKSGTDTTGIYNTGTAEFTFDGKTVRFGQLNDKPIIGDWDGDGYDEIGLFRSSTSMFYLVTRNWATLPYDVGAADKDIPFSYPEYIPIAGDWEGDGDDDIGGYYPGTFYLYLLNLGSSTATSYRDVPFGDPGDILLIGDWDNDGDDDVAVCRKYDINDNPTYYFDLDLTGVEHEIGPCEWGDNDDIPIAGRWNVGSGDKIGVYRPSTEGFHFSYDIPQIQECEGTDTSCGIYPNCENCNEDDGCYLYDNGCEERNYYCASNEAGCGYTYSNRHTDGWVDTGNTDWVDVNECLEKERKEQQYRDYYCSGGACTYSVTGTQWVDTGNTRNKPDGTICGCTASNTLKRCYGGVCTDTGSRIAKSLLFRRLVVRLKV
jgi:GH25 family lysozyme M1 (1,4-beta-N-acetylmuramidase)/surface antigen